MACSLQRDRGGRRGKAARTANAPRPSCWCPSTAKLAMVWARSGCLQSATKASSQSNISCSNCAASLLRCAGGTGVGIGGGP